MPPITLTVHLMTVVCLPCYLWCVFIDIDDSLLLKLADVQHVFLSHLLHVNEHSILDPCSQN
jgi:hypothetical protein